MIIRSGFHGDLDELREISFNGKDYLEQIQERESKRTGIPSLKIAFNNVFGYFIEVRNTHKDKVPENGEEIQLILFQLPNHFHALLK